MRRGAYTRILTSPLGGLFSNPKEVARIPSSGLGMRLRGSNPVAIHICPPCMDRFQPFSLNYKVNYSGLPKDGQPIANDSFTLSVILMLTARLFICARGNQPRRDPV